MNAGTPGSAAPDPGFAGLPYSQQGYAGKLPASMTQPVDFNDDTDELTEHVSIRFPADMIAAAKQLAAAEGMTVSAWIRREVEREAQRRERPAPESGTALYLSAVARLSAGLRDVQHACKRGDASYAIAPVAAAALADVDRLRLPQPPAAPELAELIRGWRDTMAEIADQPMSSDETAEYETLRTVIRQVEQAAALKPAPELAKGDNVRDRMQALAAEFDDLGATERSIADRQDDEALRNGALVRARIFETCATRIQGALHAAQQTQPAPGDVLWVTPGDGTAIGGLLAHVGIEPQPASGLREALTELVADWRDGSKYRPTDTRDEITEGLTVNGCADSLAAILAEHPEPQPAPGDVLSRRFFHLASELENEAANLKAAGSVSYLSRIEIAGRIRTALDTEQPSPHDEPAQAAPEAAEQRAVIDMIWRICQKPVGGRLAARIAGLIKNSGMEPF